MFVEKERKLESSVNIIYQVRLTTELYNKKQSDLLPMGYGKGEAEF